MARERARKPRYYAVAVGWRPGIYRVWSNAAKQVHGYENNVHQSFATLREAQEFMTMNRHFPPSVSTPFPPAPDTPLPPEEYVYPESDADESTTSNPSEDSRPHIAPYIQVGPPMHPSRFEEVEAISKRIVADPANLVLDVSECPCPRCPYSRVRLMEQRFLMMRRLFQLNALLPFDHVDNY